MASLKRLWNSGIGAKIGISAVVGLLTLCCACGVLGSAIGSRSPRQTANIGATAIAGGEPTDIVEPTSAEAAATPSPAPTEAPVATPSPEPTEAPTATPTEVPTEAPTAVPTPDSAADLRQYAQDVQPPLMTMSQGLKSMGVLFTDRLSEYGERGWTTEVGIAFGFVASGHEQLQDINPPPAAEALHEKLLDATGDCSLAVTTMAQALDDRDVDGMQRATVLLSSCNAKLPAVVEEMDRVK
jgi:hypothetical protein